MISYNYNDFVENKYYFRPGTVERMRFYMLCQESGWFPEMIFVFDDPLNEKDLVKWCEENCNQRWALERWYIKFENSNDAMMFKMRWG